MEKNPEFLANILQEHIVYKNQAKELRKLALNEKMAPVEDLALMSEYDICLLVIKHGYIPIIYTDEEVFLIKKEDEKIFTKIVKVLSR